MSSFSRDIDVRQNLPPVDYFLGKSIPGRPDVQLVERVDSGNDGHLFRGHSAELERDLACKVIPRSNLLHDAEGREIWRREVHKADVLKSPTVVKFEDLREWRDSGAGIDCVVLIAEFVDGPSLRRFLERSKRDVSVPLVVDWLQTMLNLFHEMKTRGVKHGDLHAGNVLVEDRSSYDLLNRYIFRVTDFGVAEATSEPRFKDDFLQLADILASLLNSIDYPTCSQKDKFVFKVLQHHFLERHLVELDPTLDALAREPRELLQRLQKLDGEFEAFKQAGDEPLLNPFDFLSSEQIGEASALLRALYSERFLGLDEIQARSNVVVTGPRGCGKSMVFRSLGLDQRLRVGEAAPEQTRYLGVYFRCLDLYFAFPRYVPPDREEALDIPLHFVTATLLSRLLDLLERWARQYFSDEFGRAQGQAAIGLWEVLGLEPPETPGRDTLKSVIARLDKERERAARWHRFVKDLKQPVGPCFGPDALPRACEALGKAFSFLRERPIYFFIDDYSSPKVTEALQKNLNRVFMQRTAVCFFKLSTESPVSFAKSDIDQKVYEEDREYSLHNLGLVYLQADVEAKLTFIADVFRRRLGKTRGFPANELQDLVGSQPEQNYNELARQIRDDKKPPFWGMETLSHLCSGDIHYVISLVGDMVQLAGGTEALKGVQEVFKIARKVQNDAIRAAAGGFLKNLRAVPGGERMVAVVEAFGSVAHSHLKYLDSKNEGGRPPKQATRIEPYKRFKLAPEAQELYDELLRYSVFIEDYRGKSRRGQVVPRLFLRRFLIPHFNLTFSTRDSIELEPQEFEEFLLRPQDFEGKNRIRSQEDVERFRSKEAERLQRQDQLEIWPDDEVS